MTLLFLLLVCMSTAWYLLGAYDGFIKGFLKGYNKGVIIGFDFAKKRYQRRRDKAGRFVA